MAPETKGDVRSSSGEVDLESECFPIDQCNVSREADGISVGARPSKPAQKHWPHVHVSSVVVSASQMVDDHVWVDLLSRTSSLVSSFQREK